MRTFLLVGKFIYQLLEVVALVVSLAAMVPEAPPGPVTLPLVMAAQR